VSPALMRRVRDTLLQAARIAQYYPHACEAPGYVARARALNHELLRLARPSCPPRLTDTCPPPASARVSTRKRGQMSAAVSAAAPSPITFASLEVSP
jgi:hypothetical protein